jgi:hypothetical protein
MGASPLGPGLSGHLPDGVHRRFDERWQDEDRRHAMLHAARLVEIEPSLLAASSYLLAVAFA